MATAQQDTPTGTMRRILSRWAKSTEEHLDEENATRSASLGGTPCDKVQPRHRATLVGPLRCVTLRPRNGVPALEAELNDGCASVTIIWLGRREITGVQPGRWVRVEGMVTELDGRNVMFNPRYELAPGPINDTTQD